MREILFRGKRVDNGEWVYGYIVKHPSAVQIGDSSPWYISVPPCDPDDNGGQYNVDPSTVGQYTGLTDKNGKKIFEGDIIQVTFESDHYPENDPETWYELFDVVFSNKYHAWFTKDDSGELVEWLREYDEDCEVIGNIHDQKE